MMLARAELPSGRAEQPRMLASYVMAEKQAELEVYRVDLADDTDVARYLTEHPVGPYKWLVAQPPARIEVAGLSATRFTYTRKDKGKEYTREYTACRRGERVYLFVASFLAADLALRDQARQVLRSVSWDK